MKIKSDNDILIEWIITSIPDILIGINTSLIKDKIQKIKCAPPLKCWLKLYKKTKCISFCIINDFRESYPECKHFFELFSLFLLCSRKDQIGIMNDIFIRYKNMTLFEKENFIKSIILYFEKLQKESDILLNDNFDNISSQQALNLFSNYEFLFFMRIIFPCVIIYGEYPSTLLRNARLGDEKSIENLIRLDKSLIFDHGISKYLHRLSFTDPYHFNQLNIKLKKDHKNLSKSKLILRFRGFLSLIGKYQEELGIKYYTSPEIRVRFETAFPDEAYSEKEPITDDSYYKQDARYRDFWKMLPKLDKK